MGIVLLITHLSLSASPLVVIDPGHGGQQDGAVGICGIKEKDAVLAISKKAQALINQTGTVRAELTRSGDVDLALADRPIIANNRGAALFVSVHANSSPSARSHGVETFFLSRKASDQYAMSLAARENGAHHEQATQAQDALGQILGKLRHQKNHQASQQFAFQLQRTLSGSIKARNRGVLQAPFMVLKATKMPAILVEVGFLTNEKECPKLGQKEHLDRIAKGLAQGIILQVQRQNSGPQARASAHPQSTGTR
jgi:N-acetylmuramoyl-L-alanine amidase